MQILSDNMTDTEPPYETLLRIARSVTDRDIELLIVDDDTMQRYNHTYRGIDKTTDVLSFPLDTQHPDAPLGSIVISAPTALRGAERFGHSVEEEITLLFIHGLLHLLGYDHECDNGEMRSKEEEIIRRFDLPESLIVRTHDKGGDQ